MFVTIFQSCNESKSKVPRFWVWVHANKLNTMDDWSLVFNTLNDVGIKGVLMGSDIEILNSVIPIASEFDIEVHAWIWAMNRGDAPENLLSVNALGESLADKKAYVDYYKFMCPGLPEVKDFIESKILELNKIEGLAGIHLDYIRYVDVFLPVGLQPKYGLVQDSVMPEFDYGYHQVMIEEFEKLTSKKLYDIDDYKNNIVWQQFRMDKITELVNGIGELSQFENMNLSAAVFPEPEMSKRMVRQDWAQWDLDYYFPMVYYNFYNESVGWVEDIIETDKERITHGNLFCGLYVPTITNEEELYHAINLAIKAGADGISFFDYRALKSHHLRAIKIASNKYGIYL